MCNFFLSFQSQLGSCEFTYSFQLFNGLLRTFSDLLLSTAISKAGNFRDPLNFREPVMKKFYILSRATEITRQYSRLPITRTKKVGVIGSSKQISKMMGRECKYHAHFTGMDIEFELE